MRRFHHTLVPAALVLAAGCSSLPPSERHLEEMQIELLEEFESTVPEFEGFLVDPYSCDFDDEGNLYVLDQRAHHIVVFDREMRAVRIIGREGDGPGEFRFGEYGANSHRLAIAGDVLAVCAIRRTISTFRLDGTFIDRFMLDTGAVDMDLDADGIIYVSTQEGANPIRAYNTSGEELRRLGSAMIPIDVAPRAREDWFEIYQANRCLLEVLPDGRIAPDSLSNRLPCTGL